MYQTGCKRILTVLCLLIAATATANDCTGSLGDPIVNITFGAGSNFGAVLPSSTTSSLRYQATACPGDGFYSITNYTSGCWGGDQNWHTTGDHTGNPNGYFMLVNTSFEPSNFYIQTISGLCEGTKYQFAAWILNMCRFRGILPNLTLSVETTDGTVLQSYATKDIPMLSPATWMQYGFFFTTPAGVSTVVLRMRNNAPGGVGNDVALDDITFRPVGSAVSIGITNYPGNSVTICAKEAGRFEFTSTVENCYAATAYQWQISTDSGTTWRNVPGATGTSYAGTPSGAGTYLYRLAVAPARNISMATCRTASEPVKIVLTDEPHPFLGLQTELCAKDSLLLTPGSFDTYRWQDGSVQPAFMVRQSGSYTVTATNACGTGFTSITIAGRSCEVIFPNAFTPGNDGRNDLFKGLNLFDVSGYHLYVFNRWGQKVFETTDPSIGWNGTLNGQPAATGLYIWYCDITRVRTAFKTRMKGTVMLLR